MARENCNGVVIHKCDRRSLLHFYWLLSCPAFALLFEAPKTRERVRECYVWLWLVHQRFLILSHRYIRSYLKFVHCAHHLFYGCDRQDWGRVQPCDRHNYEHFILHSLPFWSSGIWDITGRIDLVGGKLVRRGRTRRELWRRIRRIARTFKRKDWYKCFVHWI